MTSREELELRISRLTIVADHLEFAGDDVYARQVREEAAFHRIRLARLDGPPSGFIRVRIGASVTAEGDWAAYGARDASEQHVRRQVFHEDGEALSWVTADVPLPQVVEAEGTVES